MNTPNDTNTPQFLSGARGQAHDATYYRALIENALDGVLVVNQSATVVYCGPKIEQLLGYTAQEFVGVDALSLVHADDSERIRSLFDEILKSANVSITAEFRYKHKNGTWVWLEATGRNLLRDPNVGGIVCNFRDISQRRNYEMALQHTQEWLRHALGAARMIAWEWDIATNYVTVSENAKDYGLQSGPVESFINLLHPEDRDLVLAAVARATDGSAYNCEFRVVLPNGRMRWARDQGTVYYKDGHPVRMLGVCSDITEHRRMEGELRLWAERLKEEAQHKDEFLAMLSHELRNPLAPIRNGLQILQIPHATAPQSQKAKEMMARQIGHLTSLVDDLLDVSRISRGRILIRKERINLLAVVHTAVEDHRSEIEARGVMLNFKAAGSSIWMQGDSTRLAQVMGNLLTNAAKFTHAGGSIEVNIATGDGNHAVVRVRDTGIGIETKILERLFQPFGQAPQPIDRKSGGLGLGLALVKGLIELHGGSVQASSDGIGKGAEFSFAVPTEVVLEESKTMSPTNLGRAPSTILIIEDNTDSAESLQMMLELSGHRVSLAYCGEDGVKFAAERKPQIVLCDIGLPDIDGFQVARRVRAALPDVILIAISGYGQRADKDQAEQAGFDRHLTKPVDPQVLEQVLATVHTN